MRALLDVNVLVALLDAGHLHHRSATFDRGISLDAVPGAQKKHLLAFGA